MANPRPNIKAKLTLDKGGIDHHAPDQVWPVDVGGYRRPVIVLFALKPVAKGHEGGYEPVPSHVGRLQHLVHFLNPPVLT